MWLVKPLYELLPYYYISIGIAALAAGMYVNSWYWPQILAAGGFGGLVGGLVVLLKRRDYRSSRSRLNFEETNR
jgi:predicted MFS family arabinose efflux permease